MTPSKGAVVLQLGIVIVLTAAGLVAGAVTSVLALSAILGMVFPLIAATFFLRREGTGWRSLGFAVAMPLSRFAGYTFAALAVIYVVTSFIVSPLMHALGFPPIDISILAAEIEGNTLNYLVFLLPVSWGSAAFGEELLIRGFVLNRFAILFGEQRMTLVIVAQALLFTLGHAYQGVTGMANIMVVALVMGWIYVRCGRNLWPVIVAHGIIDTIGMTALYLGYTTL